MEIKDIEATDFVSLTEFSRKVFPDLSKITAERKVSKNFRDICDKYNIDKELYKPNGRKSYRIPLIEEKRWLLGVRHIEFALGLDLNRKQITAFVEDLIEMKNDLEKTLMVNISRDFKELKNHDDYKIPALYYSDGDISKLIFRYNFFELEDRIQEDLEYILSRAKNERRVAHAETYVREVMKQMEFVSQVTRQLIEEENSELE
ncbi:hypothetical protein [Sporosarcina sp. FSL K6-5500]|uniref:hypothetical protein n=1 Tax=Sporosarcina sp. FSL K6-5500 TaxID=2921558 RepID=UPI0030F88887